MLLFVMNVETYFLGQLFGKNVFIRETLNN